MVLLDTIVLFHLSYLPVYLPVDIDIRRPIQHNIIISFFFNYYFLVVNLSDFWFTLVLYGFILYFDWKLETFLLCSQIVIKIMTTEFFFSINITAKVCSFCRCPEIYRFLRSCVSGKFAKVLMGVVFYKCMVNITEHDTQHLAHLMRSCCQLSGFSGN